MLLDLVLGILGSTIYMQHSFVNINRYMKSDDLKMYLKTCIFGLFSLIPLPQGTDFCLRKYDFLVKQDRSSTLLSYLLAYVEFV